MKATIHVEVDEAAVRDWLAGHYDGEDAGDPAPEPIEYFRERLQELVDDELAVAMMFGPGFTFTLGEVAA